MQHQAQQAVVKTSQPAGANGSVQARGTEHGPWPTVVDVSSVRWLARAARKKAAELKSERVRVRWRTAEQAVMHAERAAAQAPRSGLGAWRRHDSKVLLDAGLALARLDPLSTVHDPHSAYDSDSSQVLPR